MPDLPAGWIDAYLARLGVTGPLEPTTELLERLSLAHLIAVPFENLSIHTGERIRLEPAWLYDKLVVRRRGGFCYELNGLFCELLRALGFAVDRLAARVYEDDGSLGIPFDHMCLRAGDRLVDVGFGDCFVRPLRLDERGIQHDGRREFRIVDDGDALVLEDAGRRGYRFGLEPYTLAEFSPGCDYHQTSLSSPFTRRRVVSRVTSTGRLTLRDDRVITTDLAGGKTEAPVGDAWSRIARDKFGL